MNKTYRLIWNDVTGQWVAAMECCKGRGKRSRAGPAGRVVRGGVAWSALATLSALFMLTPLAQAQVAANALPTGGQVVGGQAAISQSGTVMTIQQGSQRAAIDWQGFNIGSGATVNFQQPSASSVALNRVLGGNPSQIFGQLNANGQLFLSNAAGVYFAPGASANVGGLLATTLNINPADFMAGSNSFKRDGTSGSVVNEGTLQAALGGYIALLAPEVRNQGVILAQRGTVALAAGDAIDLQFDAQGGMVGLRVSATALSAVVENRGAVNVSEGLILLSARALDALQASVINSGSLSASSLTEKGGRILLEGGDITLAAGSTLNASGATGGGTVLVGGDWQGSGTLQQARRVTMDAGASVSASATQQGDGGKVVLWSTDATQFAGSIAATGAGTGSNGGNAEVSGKAGLAYNGLADLRGGQGGSAGNLLLDPYNLYIVAGSTGTVTAASNDSQLGVDTLTTQLATANVTVSTGASGSQSGRIVATTDITSAATNNLTLSAAGDVVLNGNVSLGGKLTVAAVGDFVMGINAASGAGNSISANGGFDKTGAGTSYLSGDITTQNTAISLAGPVQIANFNGSSALAINSNGGNIGLTGALSAWSGTAQSYAVFVNGKSYDNVTSAAVAGSSTDIYLQYGAGSSIFIAPTGVSSVQYLVAGGGGGGGWSNYGAWSGAGGGGGVADGSLSVTAGTGVSVSVGAGGTGNATGGDTTFSTIKAGGGGGGGNSYSGNNNWTPATGLAGNGGAGYAVGGGGGGGGVVNGGNPSGGNGGVGTQRTGGYGSWSFSCGGSYCPGGGGGAAAASVGPTGTGGAGVTSSVTGTSITYGGGGSGDNAAAAAAAGSGGGGTVNPGGNNGTAGAIILRYSIGAGTTAATSGLNLNAGAGAVTLGSTVSNLSSLTVNAGGASSVAGVISGSTVLTKQGSGTLTLNGAGTYSGGSTVSGGVLKAGLSTTGSVTNGPFGTGAVTVASGAALDLNGKTIANAVTAGGTGVASSGAIYNSTATAATLSGALTLSSDTSINSTVSGALTLGGTVNGAHALTVTTNGATDGAYVQTGVVGGTTALTSYTVNAGTASITMSGAATVAGPVNMTGGSIAINAALNTGSNDLTLNSAGSVTQTAALTAGGLALLGGGNFTLTNTSNNVATLAGSTGNVSYRDADALAIGTVGSTVGMTATGTVDVGTQTGNLSLTQNLTTTNAAVSAAVLNAGIATAAGISTGGDIVVTSGKAVTVGAGGTAKLYTGSVAGSTNLGSMSGLGSGSGRFRYYSDESATNYTTALGTGLNTIYRERPTVTPTVDNQTMTYGSSLPSWTYSFSGVSNGDTVSWSTGPTVTVGGSQSTSSNFTAGSHAVSASGGASTSATGLGYNVATTNNGTLAVNQRTLTASVTGTNKTYDASTTATVTTSDNRLSSDVLTISQSSASFDTKNVGTGKTVSVSGIGISGADVANYTLASTTATTSADVTTKSLTADTSGGVSKVYDGTSAMTGVPIGLTGIITGETVTAAGTGNISQANVGNNLAYSVSGLTLSGSDAGNYVLSSTGPYSGNNASITPANLIATANNDSKSYSGLAYSGGNGVVYSGFVNGETSAVLSGSLVYGGDSQGAVSAGNYAILPSGLSSGNYTVSYTSGNLAIQPPPPNPPNNGGTPGGGIPGGGTPGGDPSGGGLIDERTTPGGGGTPTNGGTTPSDGGAPANGGTTPGGGGIPTNGGTTPSDGGAPANGGTTPGGGGNPANGGITPSNGGATPSGTPAAGGTTIPAGSSVSSDSSDSAVSGESANSAGVSVALNRLPVSDDNGLISVTVPKDTATSGRGFSFALPERVSAEVSQNSRVQVSTPDGPPLPSWLRFDTKTLRFFAAAVPDGSLPFRVLVRVDRSSFVVVISERTE